MSNTPVPREDEAVVVATVSLLGVTAPDRDLAFKVVGVREQHRRFGAVDFQQGTRQRGVEGEHGLGGLARLELHQCAYVARYRDIELLTCFRAGADYPTLPSLGPERSYRGGGAEHLHNCGEVVRPEVEQRSSTGCVEKCRIRMP